MNRVHKANERLTDAEVRRRLEEAVEIAIAALDAFDGDADLEACCDDDQNTGDDEYSNGGRDNLEFGAEDYGDLCWSESIDQTAQPISGSHLSTSTHYA